MVVEGESSEKMDEKESNIQKDFENWEDLPKRRVPEGLFVDDLFVLFDEFLTPFSKIL